MSIGPEIQKTLYDSFMIAPAISDGRIFDHVPQGATFPYVTIGDEQRIDDGNGCDDGWEVYADVHIWSRSVGRVEVKQLMALVETRIKAIASIDGFSLISVNIETSRILMEPDGLTAHGVITPKFLINPA